MSEERAAAPWHGTPGGYSNHRCRCESCTTAWVEYRAARGYQKRYHARLREAGISLHATFANPGRP